MIMRGKKSVRRFEVFNVPFPTFISFSRRRFEVLDVPFISLFSITGSLSPFRAPNAPACTKHSLVVH